jgi:signal transduction histidine kinase
MRELRSTPQQLITLAVSGGLLFLFGAIIATMSHTAPVELMVAGGAFALLSAYTLILNARASATTRRCKALEADIERLRRTQENLRSRMAFTLRDPLATIVGFTDTMADSPEMTHDEQRELLIAVRDNAREVERVLATMAPSDAIDDTSTYVQGVVLLDDEVRSVASAVHADTLFESDLERARAWADSAHVRQLLRTLIRAVQRSGCTHATLRTSQRAGRATVTISARDELLTAEGIAALTGNAQASDAESETYVSLKSAHHLAGEMNGSIGFAQAFGVSHIVLELPAAPDDLGLQSPKQVTRNALDMPFGTVVGLRPERPTSAIRFN